jgi:hypothetical protein
VPVIGLVAVGSAHKIIKNNKELNYHYYYYIIITVALTEFLLLSMIEVALLVFACINVSVLTSYLAFGLLSQHVNK